MGYILLIVITVIALIIMTVYAWYINNDWYEYCERLNNDWCEYCERYVKNIEEDEK